MPYRHCANFRGVNIWDENLSTDQRNYRDSTKSMSNRGNGKCNGNGCKSNLMFFSILIANQCTLPIAEQCDVNSY